MKKHRALSLPVMVALIMATLMLTPPTRSHQLSPVDVAGSEIAQKRAHELYARGDLGGAIRVLEDAIDVEPRDPQLHFMLANAFLRQEAWDSAVRHYEKATQLRPSHPDTYLGLGHARFRAGRVDEAVRAWQTAVDRSPHDALPHLALALGLAELHQVPEGRLHAKRARELDSGWQQRLAIDFRWTEKMVEQVLQLMEK